MVLVWCRDDEGGPGDCFDGGDGTKSFGTR